MANMNKITTDQIIKGGMVIAEYVVTTIKSILIVFGVVATSLADVTFGAITLGLLLTNINFDVPFAQYLPWIISIGASGMQIVLWQMVEDRRGIMSIFDKLSTSVALSIIGAVTILVADTYMDVQSINYMMFGSTISSYLSPLAYKWLRISIFLIATVMASLSEVFMVLAFNFFKQSAKQQNFKPAKQDQNTRPHKSIYKPKHRPDFSDLADRVFGLDEDAVG